MSKQKLFFMISISLFLTNTSFVNREAHAHHGSVSAAFGPGAPVETSSPLTLPKNGWLVYEKLQYVPYKTYKRNNPENVTQFMFYNTLIGYGFTDYLSAYAIVPYAQKKQDSLGTSQGVGDVELVFHLGFKYADKGGVRDWYLFGPEDSKGKQDTIDDWKFALLGSFTIPSGVTTTRDNNGDPFDLGMQPGFGGTVYSITGVVSKMVIPRLTLGMDAVFRTFSQTNEGKAANEYRSNFAAVYELIENPGGAVSRFDLIAEANYLHLDKDIDPDRLINEESNSANTGGDILYLSPGLRLTFFDRVSFGALIQFPAAISLNEQKHLGEHQQGAEGLEKFRLSTVLSMSF